MKSLFQAYHLLILFSLTETTIATAVPRYAKPGCNDTCGNVRIPYPFGIGANCSINKWYVVDCHSSTPYLSALNQLEILGVNLENQTVTVNTPKISYCQNPVPNNGLTMSVDLGGSPFLYSKSHNKFVFEGCGNAVMMDNGSRVLTGCATNCLGDFVSDRNKCFGISCCQTTIPHSLRLYNVNITGDNGYDRGCGSAFLVDENSYVSEENSSDVPVSLLWTLSQGDIDQEVGKFTPAIKREFASFVVNSNKRVVPKYAKPGCSDICGNVKIPYPFGIGGDCSVNQWYIIECNSSTPYLSAFGHLEVLDVNTANQTITVNTPKISACQNSIRKSSKTMSIDLGLSPFLFSKSHNIFVFEGCGNAVMMDQGSQVLTGCSTNCHNGSRGDRNNCFGISCCQTTIPHYLKSYNINITRQAGDDRACGSAFLMDENSYVKGTFSEENSSYVPISLLWTLSEDDINNVSCYYSPGTLEVDLGNRTTMKSWKCQFFEFFSNYNFPQGNPYVGDGLNDTEDCARCKDDGSYCLYDTTYYYDADYLIKLKLSCIGTQLSSSAKAPANAEAPDFEKVPKNDKVIKSSKTSLGLILGISISIGGPFVVATSYILYKVIKQTIARRRRKRFFKRNGGLLLKQQQEADPSIVDKTILFTSHELKKATDNFNESKVLGRGGQGTVYKGVLADGRIVAVKKSKVFDESQLEQFINEVVILSQVNHRNVVKLLGCCLETEVPMLVSEFIPNGTLYDRLHNDDSPISLETRLQIATEVAGALAYLHSATSLQIYHRDIKTTNILLDDNYRAKVSDFGTSRFVAIDKSHLTTLVKGTFGYLDPEYFQSSQFTEKSDVYSFGVVLVELLTGEKPISLARSDEHRSLATHFMLAMEEGSAMSIFDAVVINEGSRDELLAIANLAMRCLNLNGRNRPTMKEVANELETIRTSHIASTAQTSMEL
ncbi:putative protein kinase RLK-Pelle-WAK family [Helianthus annuus]|nr:putative protein kinase RLK-Pelle-WAK family [Helianthus annuus]